MLLKKLFFAVAISGLVVTSAHASDVKHFKGEQPKNLAEAFSILAKYNAKLEAATSSEPTPMQMSEIHQMTYSLENALEFIDDHIDEVEENLEHVHKASERMDTKTVLEKGKAYLMGSKELLDN